MHTNTQWSDQTSFLTFGRVHFAQVYWSSNTLLHLFLLCLISIEFFGTFQFRLCFRTRLRETSRLLLRLTVTQRTYEETRAQRSILYIFFYRNGNRYSVPTEYLKSRQQLRQRIPTSFRRPLACRLSNKLLAPFRRTRVRAEPRAKLSREVRVPCRL